MGDLSLEVGIVGAGIGGVMASIAIARAGAKVTVLEAASQLGEIGAGIQMTPNVARLLLRYEVDKAIDKNLVRFTEYNMRNKHGTPIGWTKISRIESILGYPWWLVHRHHLHTGLVEVAQANGVNLVIDTRVSSFQQLHDNKVIVKTERGKLYTFDLVIGADGVHSVTRRHLFPDVKPRPPTGNCAYRATLPYEKVRADPVAKSLVEDANGKLIRTMETWVAPSGYVITYPIANATVFNIVLSHFRDPPVETVTEVSVEEVRNDYKGFDPRITRLLDLLEPPISRWPLLVTGPLESWSNDEKTIVLMGDAAHSMTNHMAQGAATSMEDGCFLGRCLRAVTSGRISLRDAVEIYEKGRMPKASYKQQVSYLNGWIWMLPHGPAQEARDKAMQVELRGEVPLKSPNLYGDPTSVQECYGYDAEAHAEDEIATWLNNRRDVRDAATTVVQHEADKIANWFLPEKLRFRIQPKL